ncbi:MAG: inorganic pyrophosphatase [Caulobacteraceae bacterium]|nr:inorganic pyrophosphatase [Caulobacteraceae bacterium]
MPGDIANIPHQLNDDGECRVVVETTKASRSKYVHSPELGAFELRKLLPEGMSFPLDFGFVPSTRAEDGDPLDVLVLHDEPIVMGAVVTVRLIGVIEAEQTEDGKTERNDRLVAVCIHSQLYRAFGRLEDLGGDFIDHLKQFFVNFNRLEGKSFDVLRLGDRAGAIEAVRRTSIPPG